MSESMEAFVVIGIVSILSIALTGSLLPGFILLILAAMFG